MDARNDPLGAILFRTRLFRSDHQPQQEIQRSLIQIQNVSYDPIHSFTWDQKPQGILTINTWQRRGSPPDFRVPLFFDKNTNQEEISRTQPYPGSISMDAKAFGGGLYKLQCTFGAQNMNQARYFYDQLHTVSPLLLALTAGAPFFKGMISDTDSGWDAFEGACDCRTEKQRNPLHQKYISNSRASPSQLYIWPGPFNKPQYNDANLNVSQQTIDYIYSADKELEVQIDDLLVTHIANLFKREALILLEAFKEMGMEQPYIFNTINHTNYNSVKLKAPPEESAGWLVQFRPMEMQLIRVLCLNPATNFYIPISKVNQNFQRAVQRDALRKQKFWFKINILDQGDPIMKELTLYQFLFGNQNFVGIFNFIKKELLNREKLNTEENLKIFGQLEAYLRDLTSGKILTLAQWMRQYVDSHKDYPHNSILPKKVMDDMLLTLYNISMGTAQEQNFPKVFK